jgi:hypothetical protein
MFRLGSFLLEFKKVFSKTGIYYKKNSAYAHDHYFCTPNSTKKECYQNFSSSCVHYELNAITLRRHEVIINNIATKKEIKISNCTHTPLSLDSRV